MHAVQSEREFVIFDQSWFRRRDLLKYGWGGGKITVTNFPVECGNRIYMWYLSVTYSISRVEWDLFTGYKMNPSIKAGMC